MSSTMKIGAMEPAIGYGSSDKKDPLQESRVSLNVPQRRNTHEGLSSRSSENKTNSDAHSLSSKKSGASISSKRRAGKSAPSQPQQSQLPRRKSLQVSKTSKAQKRFQKVLDQDELMVMEGFDQDVRNEAVIQKRVKGLTKKSKKEHLKMNVTDDVIRALSSQSPRTQHMVSRISR